MSSTVVSPEPDVERPKKNEKEFNLRSSLALVGAFLALFCTMGFQNAFGVFQEYYGQNILQHHSEFDIAWIGSLLTCTLFFAAAPAGILADRLGPTIPLIIGSIGSLIAVFMVSLCNRLYQFLLAQGVLLGISNAFLLCPAMAMVSHLFDRHRAVASGIMVSGSSIGGIIWPIALDQLLHKDGVSFGWSFRIIGFIILPLCVIMVLTIRPPPNRDAGHENPQTETKPSAEGDSDSNPSIALVKNPTFLLLCGGLSLATFGLFSPLFFLSTYAVSKGLSSSLAFYIVSMLNGASLVGRVSMGYVADRYGNFNLCFLMVALSGIIAMCWTKATSLAEIVVFSLAYGFSSGAMFSLQTPCAVQLATPESKGTAIGILLIAPAIPGLVGTPISGHFVERGCLTLSMFSGAMLLGGSIFVLSARLRQSRKLFVKV